MHLQYETELYHHGIRGQKWGVRRYQNADGSYTAAGRKRYAKGLTKQFNDATVGVAGSRYRYQKNTDYAHQNAELAQRRQLSRSRVVRFIGGLNAKAAKKFEKSAAEEKENYDKYVKLAEHALDAASKSGFTSNFYKAERVIDKEYNANYTRIVYQKISQVKIVDPTQPKNRAERREEKDMNRVKNASYEENQARNRMREAQDKAERDVGSRPVKGYRGQREWKDPEHKSVKAATSSVTKWMSAQERFADEYDRYKKRHPNSTQSLRDFAKQREKNLYPVKKKYK